MEKMSILYKETGPVKLTLSRWVKHIGERCEEKLSWQGISCRASLRHEVIRGQTVWETK